MTGGSIDNLNVELPTSQAENASSCIAPGCGREVWARSLCAAHYQRWRRWGNIADRKREAPVTFDEDGYVKWKGRSVHRIVLFKQIGYGPHQCHWCGEHVNWTEGARGSGTWTGVLTVDHVDHDRTNNRPSNLVPACHRCNTGRTKARAHLYRPYRDV
jgi:hypothetical protein